MKDRTVAGKDGLRGSSTEAGRKPRTFGISRAARAMLKRAAPKSLPGDGIRVHGSAAVSTARALERKGLGLLTEAYIGFGLFTRRFYATRLGKEIADHV